jgi:hypothetical protein
VVNERAASKSLERACIVRQKKVRASSYPKA